MFKYNLALTPIFNGAEVIRCANQLSKLANRYLLGKNSLPHVTLYHFKAEEKDIENIWRGVGEVWKEEQIELEFKEFSCVTFDKVIFSISLLPDKIDELHKMHGLIAQVLSKPIKKNFDPHMTLLNTKNKDRVKDVEILKKSYKPIIDKFILSLGRSDDVGQLTEIIFGNRVEAG